MRYEPFSEWQARMKRESGVQVGTHVWRKCFKKRRHNTQGLAEAAGRSMLKRYDIKQSAYHCLRCDGWHTRTDTDPEIEYAEPTITVSDSNGSVPEG